MSRAFVREDGAEPPGPVYRLPPRDDPGYDAAAAKALLSGARVGDTDGAEAATGFAWGSEQLRPHVEHLLTEARANNDERLIQVAERFLRHVSR